MEKVELSEEPGGGWGRQEGRTRISQLLLRWPGESASGLRPRSAEGLSRIDGRS